MQEMRVPKPRKTISSTRIMIAYLAKTTLRSPKVKRIAIEETSKDKILWGDESKQIPKYAN